MVRGPLLNRMLSYVAVTLVAYLIVLLIFWAFEKQLIFFPNYPGRLTGEWKPAGLPLEDVWLRTADGVKLHAWWIGAERAEFTFVAFHGNAGNITHRADVYRFLRELPANVLAVEYRGYGRSEGSPSEAGLYRDAEAAYDYLVRQRGMAASRIISFGQSLGSAIAVDLAASHPVAGVVLEAPFPSARRVAQRVYPFLPGLGWVARSKFNTAAKLSRIRAPVLVVHCTRDPVIAFLLGEEVYRLAGEPKSLLRIEASCHEEASLVAPVEYRAQLLVFVRSLQAPH